MYQETAGDLERKWCGSYCKYNDKLTYWEAFTTEGSQIFGSFIRHNRGTDACPVDPSLFEPLSIPNGLFNVPIKLQDRFDERYATACWRHYRNPRRSPVRGVNNNSHIWVSPLGPVVGADMSLRWSFPLLEAVLDPKYVNYHQAFEEVRSGKMVAIDRGWGIALNPTSETDGRHLFASVYGFCGWAYPDRIVIKHRGSYQEALDFVRRSRLDVPVILDANN